MADIRHIWFDMDGTLTVHTDEFNKVHNDLVVKTYASVVGRKIDDSLIQEYMDLYNKYGSNSLTFVALGKPSNYWMQHFDTLDQMKYYEPTPDVYEILDKLRKLVPVSLFTNASLANAQKTLSVVKIDIDWFTYVLSGDDVQNRKPALDGFHMMIKKSGIPANCVLYVGDRVNADVKPAKAVGMKTAIVYSQAEEADYSFAKFSDLLSLFD